MANHLACTTKTMMTSTMTRRVGTNQRFQLTTLTRRFKKSFTWSSNPWALMEIQNSQTTTKVFTTIQ
jgi:hypothetical protein